MLSRVSSQLHKCLIIIFFTASYLQIFSWARLAFHCPLCVWQVKRGGAEGWGWGVGQGGNSSEENQNPHSRFKAVFIWFPLNLPHQAPWSISAPLTPLMCDRPQLLTQSRASLTLQCHPHLDRYAIKNYEADLRHLGAEISSDSTAHTPRTENSLEATKENGCPWHHSARIWFSLFSRKLGCDHHLSGKKQFIRPPRSFIKIPTLSVLRILNLLIFSKKNIQL